MEEAPGSPVSFDFGDADLRAALFAAVRTTTILGLAAASLVLLVWGWRSAMMLVMGALVSASGIWEAQRLIHAINGRLDRQQGAGAVGPVALLFVFRLLLAAAILYGSLRFLHGSVYALLAGLALAVVALSYQALRMLRRQTP